METCDCHKKYLSLPTMAGRSKKELFSFIKSKVWKHLNSWQEKLFSQGGKEILLKAVIKAIPTFAMSCLHLPVSLCKSLETLMARFWWESVGDAKKDTLDRLEEDVPIQRRRGLGFRSLLDFNQSFPCKASLANPFPAEWSLSSYFQS